MQSFVCSLILVIHGASGYSNPSSTRYFNRPGNLPIFGSHRKGLTNEKSLRGSKGSEATKSPSSDFHYLKKLDARVKRLSDRESDYLLSFWSDALKCFQIYPNMSTTRVSITTTCMTISAILANPSHWERSCRWDSIVGSSGPDNMGGKIAERCLCDC